MVRTIIAQIKNHPRYLYLAFLVVITFLTENNYLNGYIDYPIFQCTVYGKYISI